MPNDNSIQSSFRLTSVEPLDSVGAKVREIANAHGFQLSMDKQYVENAPFCGYDFFQQQMTLQSDSGTGATLQKKMQHCLSEIEKTTEETVADGFLEILDCPTN